MGAVLKISALLSCMKRPLEACGHPQQQQQRLRPLLALPPGSLLLDGPRSACPPVLALMIRWRLMEQTLVVAANELC